MGYYYYRMPASQRVAVQGGEVAAVCDYLLLAPFDGADDQGYANAQVLDTEAEGVAVGSLAVDETDGVAALVSDKLSLSGKAGAAWNLGLQGATAITRAIGTAYLLRAQADNITDKLWGFGFHDVNNDLDPANADHAFEIGAAGGIVQKNGDGPTQAQVGVIVADTLYQFALVLGGYDSNGQPWYSGAVGTFIHGAAWFIKGGGYTDWTLLWRDVSQNTATVYPFISQNGTAFTALADYLRVPDNDYSTVLQPTAADWFTDTNGTGLDAHTPDVDPGGGWTEHTGAWEINGNHARQLNAPVGGLQMGATLDSGISDVFIRVAATTGGAGRCACSIRFRFSDINNHWEAQISAWTDQVTLWEWNAGVPTARAQTAETIDLSTSYELTVIALENDIQVWVNGTTRLSHTSALHASNTRHGIGEYRDSVNYTEENTFDKFHVQPASVYADLDECPGYAVTP